MKSVIKISIVFFLSFHFLNIQPVFNKSVSDLNISGKQKWIKVPFRTAKQKAMGYTGGETGQQAFSIAISPSDPDYLAIAIDTAAVYISKDGARSWELKRSGIISSGVQSVAFDPGNPKILWATGTNGYLRNPSVEGIYRTIDGGKTWKQLKYPIKAIFASNGDIVYATRLSNNKKEGEVLRSDDQGDTWKVLSGKIYTLGNLIEIDVDPTDPDRLYAASDLGVWVFDGNVWSVRDERHGLKKPCMVI